MLLVNRLVSINVFTWWVMIYSLPANTNILLSATNLFQSRFFIEKKCINVAGFYLCIELKLEGKKNSHLHHCVFYYLSFTIIPK